MLSFGAHWLNTSLLLSWGGYRLLFEMVDGKEALRTGGPGRSLGSTTLGSIRDEKQGPCSDLRRGLRAEAIHSQFELAPGWWWRENSGR